MHAPDWHILDTAFSDAARGLTPPARRLSSGGASLRIANFDRADPPGWTPGTNPRGETFNANVVRITAEPCMPLLPVVCEITGFDPAATPIEWRLVCRHVLCRFRNAGQFRYQSQCRTYDREWRGRSASPKFTLFGEDCPCSYNEPGRVQGGHALLMAGAAVPGGALVDYVHLRIAGTNPKPEDVLRYLDSRLAGYHPNIVAMLRAVFRHESSLAQFAPAAQTGASMRFTKVHHKEAGQSDCRVRFDWPDDPPEFPLASYDFGVGISQWTDVGAQQVTADVAWDWRENLRSGINRLLGAVARSAKPGVSWREAARIAWTAYNGTGPAAAAYAARLAASPDGASIADTPVAGLAEVALLEPPPSLAAPVPWIAV